MKIILKLKYYYVLSPSWTPSWTFERLMQILHVYGPKIQRYGVSIIAPAVAWAYSHATIANMSTAQFQKVFELHSPVVLSASQLQKFGTVFHLTLLKLLCRTQLLASSLIWRHIYTDNYFPNNDHVFTPHMRFKLDSSAHWRIINLFTYLYWYHQKNVTLMLLPGQGQKRYFGSRLEVLAQDNDTM